MNGRNRFIRVMAASASVICLVLVLSESGAGAAGPPIMWGMSSQNAATIEAAQGRQFSLVRTFRSIGDAAYAASDQKLVAKGHHLMVSIGPNDKTNAPIKLSAIANGAYDTYFAAQFDALESVPAQTFFAFDHEPNSPQHLKSCDDPKNCAASFVAAWRHLHDLAVSRGDTNIVWVWTMMSAYFRNHSDAASTTWFPGAAYADRVGLDAYPTNCDGTGPDGAPQSLAGLIGAGRNWADAHVPAMPILIPEWGAPSSTDAARKAWFQRAYSDAVAGNLGHVVAISYFNNSAGMKCPWALDKAAPSFSVFAAMGHDAVFSGAAA